MARAKARGKTGKGGRRRKAAARKPWRWRLWLLRGLAGAVALLVGFVLLWSVFNPPTTPYMFSEGRRMGGVVQDWVPLDEVAPVMARTVVAAEDANFCLHWGFDVDAIRATLDAGRRGGASTISQQVVKNVYLWHGRSWPRKVLEAMITPLVELIWPKRRILEVYLNVAEFGEGVFGIEAAAQHWFGVRAADLSGAQAARLAAILPDPKNRSPANPSDFLRRRAAAILDGAATIAADGRADCLALHP